MTFIRHHKHHFGAFAILIIIAVVSGYFAFGTTPNKTQKTRLPEPEAQADGGQAINITQTTKDEKIDAITSTTSNIKNGLQELNSATIKQLTNPLTIRVDGKDYYTEFTSSTTVYDLMNQLEAKNKISFSGKEYAGMGFFVDEINGVKNDNLAGKYWIYYINGESAQVGISNYVIKPNDLIEWKYETANL